MVSPDIIAAVRRHGVIVASGKGLIDGARQDAGDAVKIIAERRRHLGDPHAPLLVQNGVELLDLQDVENLLLIVLESKAVRAVLPLEELPLLEALAPVKVRLGAEELDSFQRRADRAVQSVLVGEHEHILVQGETGLDATEKLEQAEQSDLSGRPLPFLLSSSRRFQDCMKP